jgi:hypothetical protein
VSTAPRCIPIADARVALTLTEASEVQPDEILIVPVIDVG